MTVYGRILLAGGGSALILLGALAFQYLGGLAPCPMCLWQRWPHAVAVAIAVLAVTVLWWGRRWLAGLGGAAMAVSAGLGVFHAGVEWRFWDGPSSCVSSSIEGLTPEQLLDQILAAPVVRCDEVAWDFLGLSLAGWNAVFSVGFAALWAASVVWWRMPLAPG
ncbi:MAG: disulfide bond formation protein B, partial [Pseudomonadota bacterium]